MARAIQVIKDQIRAWKNTEPDLNGTNFAQVKFFEEGGSKTGTTNLTAYLVSLAINLHEQLWDLFKIELQAIADKANTGNSQWLQNQILNFQNGDTLLLDNFIPRYSSQDLTKRIITACAIIDNGNRVILAKVAKTVSAGPPVVLGKLSSSELTNLQNAVNSFKFAGTQVKVTSQDPDKIYVKAKITYDKTRVEATVKTNVLAAINTYLQSFSLNQFNGIIYPSKLSDVIQAVDGVINVYFEELQGRGELILTVAEGENFTTGAYQSEAGYAIAETTAGFTLNDSISLI